MSCREAQARLDAYVDDELDLGAALAMEDHLAACKRCRTEAACLRAVGAVLRRCADADEAPPALARRLRARYGRQAGLPAAARRRYGAFAAVGAALLALAIGFRADAPPQPRAPQAGVVYHISHSATARAALGTLRNHLEAAPGTQVIVVAHNNGIDFLLEGARDEAGELYENAVRQFAERGVQFRVCNNTLVRQKLDASRVLPVATVVPSGIAEIARLQSQENYVYMRL